MGMIEQKKRIMMMQKKASSELYPVGTDVYVYFGVIFQKNSTVDINTGEVVSGGYAVSDFIEVSESYEYTRGYRLYGVYNYDENYNYLGGQAGVNDLNSSVISKFIEGTKYIRTTVHNIYVNDESKQIGNHGSYLKRTA